MQNIGFQSQIILIKHCVFITHKRYLVSTPSFSAINFLLSSGCSFNRLFSIQNSLFLFSSENLMFSKKIKLFFFLWLLTLFIEAFHIQKVSSTLYTCHLTNTSRHVANSNSTRSLTISDDLNFPWDTHLISLKEAKLLILQIALFSSFLKIIVVFFSITSCQVTLRRYLLPRFILLGADTFSCSEMLNS